jgi:hypothetical protein
MNTKGQMRMAALGGAAIAIGIAAVINATGEAQVPPTGDAQVQVVPTETPAPHETLDPTLRQQYYDVYGWCEDEFALQVNVDACQTGAALMTAHIQEQRGERV